MPKTLTNLDIDLVRTFATIARLGSFTQAAEQLGRQQSTISLQIGRLESAVNAKLLERSPRAVALTTEGKLFLDYAQKLLDLNDEAVARFGEPMVTGVVRLGTPEDFATRHLPEVLARFAQAYPSVALEVTCDLTLNLVDRFRAGDFDLVLVKQEPSVRAKGLRVWREPLVWVSGSRDFLHHGAKVPLVVSPPPCVYRKRATTALDRARKPWRISYTCAALSGAHAAVKAGLGLAVLPKDMVPAGLHVLDGHDLPDLKDTEIALLEVKGLSLPAQRLKQHIVRSLE
ncbi:MULTISPECIES: LysR substrate-binding domain-containing protein [unclassified Bradyrhizobium]|uniref:LysR substrate-binding domain-containing protein n=1 Tax=unclassified Bradyrhizobium TaxID=2631580 RepID=UPI0028E63055|nr:MULTISPECIES: LysR substrate-binding domain-containing protein [unclassified Bradyrhizobium]